MALISEDMRVGALGTEYNLVYRVGDTIISLPKVGTGIWEYSNISVYLAPVVLNYPVPVNVQFIGDGGGFLGGGYIGGTIDSYCVSCPVRLIGPHFIRITCANPDATLYVSVTYRRVIQ